MEGAAGVFVARLVVVEGLVGWLRRGPVLGEVLAIRLAVCHGERGIGMVTAALVGESRLGVEEGEGAVHIDVARLVVRARDAVVDAAVLQIGIGAEGVRQPVGGLQERVVIELLAPAAVILIVGPRHSLDGLHPDDAPEVIARVVVDRGAPDGLQSVVGVGQAGQRAVEVVLEPLAPHQVGTLLLLAVGALEIGQLVSRILGASLVIFVIPAAVGVM